LTRRLCNQPHAEQRLGISRCRFKHLLEARFRLTRAAEEHECQAETATSLEVRWIRFQSAAQPNFGFLQISHPAKHIAEVVARFDIVRGQGERLTKLLLRLYKFTELA
jgi:hypothetical protein